MAGAIVWTLCLTGPLPATEASQPVVARNECSNLLETVPPGVTPSPVEHALVADFADRVNHVEAVYNEAGSVTHLV